MTTSQLTPPYRFVFLVVFSAALMLVDHHSELLARARAFGSVLNLPFQALIAAPGAARDSLAAQFQDRDLTRKYAALQAKQARLEARLQRFDALVAENRRLSAFLAAPHRAGERVTLAEIADLGLAPFTHRVGLNRGVEAGVYLGQPVILPQGVLGQVSGLGVKHSVVTLLTDSSHAIPALIQRNGLRVIVRGVGAAGQLSLPFLSAQADIRTGDVLVTSGLGGGFPPGYKVARVAEIAADSTAEFLAVRAIPFADIRFAEHVLLLSAAPAEAAESEPAENSPPNSEANSAADAEANSAGAASAAETPQ